ncbi:MAG: hypothetical protein C0392_02800 [Syntrophus sp. (in: bacteria)]|nr:hypothetical protein [Syntrophus sp. (in: bacteria)]
MTPSLSYRTLFTGTFIILSFLAGCGSSPPSRMYTLNSLAAPKSADTTVITKDFIVVGIGPLEIPDYLDRPQIVTRTSRNELKLAEFDLWGSPLASDISRSIAENLSSLLKGDSIAVLPWRVHIKSRYRVPVGIERFDVTPDSAVILKARWGVIEKDSTIPQIVRESVITKPLKGSQYSEIVAAMSEALTDLSKEMAADIKSVIRANATQKTEKPADGGK